MALGGSIAAASVERCSVNLVSAPGRRGELSFTDCRFQPDVRKALSGTLHALESTLGTRFTNCTVHAPRVAGALDGERLNSLGFLQINGPVRDYHTNTALGNDILNHLRGQGVALTPEFIGKRRAHHALGQP